MLARTPDFTGETICAAALSNAFAQGAFGVSAGEIKARPGRAEDRTAAERAGWNTDLCVSTDEDLAIDFGDQLNINQKALDSFNATAPKPLAVGDRVLVIVGKLHSAIHLQLRG